VPSAVALLRDRFAFDQTDTVEDRSAKFAALIVAGSCCVAGIAWTAMYWIVFGWGFVAALPLSFVLVVGASIGVAHRRRDHRYAIYAQIVCIVYITALIQWSIGGVFDAGAVMVWAFLGPVTALAFLPLRQSLAWLSLFLVNVIVTVALDDTFADRALEVSDTTQRFFFLVNLGGCAIVVFAFASYFVATALRERENANRLLLNVLPREIAPRLKASDDTIAEQHEAASVLFADIVGSTGLFTRLTAPEAVEWLNGVFSAFDGLVEDYGVEKIRTIGDNYMVAAGVPSPRDDHAESLVALALRMMEVLDELPSFDGERVTFRIGINSGPLVAGVLGTSKFHYDVWGDTVNVASRMESHGEPGRIQITDDTYRLVEHRFTCEPRGTIDVRGRGSMTTWWVLGER
jgi:guanylate cyclase